MHFLITALRQGKLGPLAKVKEPLNILIFAFCGVPVNGKAVKGQLP